MSKMAKKGTSFQEVKFCKWHRYNFCETEVGSVSLECSYLKMFVLTSVWMILELVMSLNIKCAFDLARVVMSNVIPDNKAAGVKIGSTVCVKMCLEQSMENALKWFLWPGHLKML